jgi:ribosomal protein S16
MDAVQRRITEGALSSERLKRLSQQTGKNVANQFVGNSGD